MASSTEVKEKTSDSSSNNSTMLPTPELEDTPASSGSSTIAAEAKEWQPTPQLYVIFLTMCVITLMAALDATSISVALPTIAKKLHGTAVEAFWSGSSFLLCSTVLQPVFASFSNIFGRKPMVLVALVFFAVGSLVAGIANNFTVMLAGRSVQGIGGGGLLVLTEIIITDIVPLRLRGKYFGILSSMWALGSVLGPIMGGGFAQDVSWRWILYINLPFCGIAFILVPLFLNLTQKMDSVWMKLRRVDWVGAIIFVASTTAVLIPISWGGVMYPWSHWKTLVPLLLGFSGLLALVAWEIYGAVEPLITLRVFMNRTAAVSYFGTVMHGIILWALLFFLPLYFMAAKDMGPVMTGVALFPQTFTIAPAAITVGIMVTVTGRFRWSVWTGWTLTTLGVGLMYLLEKDTSIVKWIFINLVAGVGTGMLFPSMSFAVQASASNEDTAIAIAMFTFLRAFGQCFGIAIGGVIFQNAFLKELGKHPQLVEVAGEYAMDAVALVEVIRNMPVNAGRELLVECYVDALRMVWVAMTAFAALGGAASMGTQELPLDRVLVTEQGLREKKRVEDREEGV